MKTKLSPMINEFKVISERGKMLRFGQYEKVSRTCFNATCKAVKKNLIKEGLIDDDEEKVSNR